MLVKAADTSPRKQPSRAGRKSTERLGNAVRSPFQLILEEILPPEQENLDLHSLWSRLPDLEKDLIAKPVQENLDTYKDAVRKIARETLRKNVRVKKLRRKNRRNEIVELNVIEILDDRLQKMALMMQSPANSAFTLLKTMDEIRGILLDVRE